MMYRIIEKQRYLYLAFFTFFTQFFVANIYYYDDLFRVQNRYFGWKADGRILGELFYKVLLFFRGSLPDIYPLPFIIAGFFFCYMLYKCFIGFDIKDQKKQSLLLLVVVAGPLVLANWLYRYDGAFMLLSIGFAMYPFYYAKEGGLRWFLVSTVFILGALNTYQSSINIYIGLTVTFLFKCIEEQRPIKEILLYLFYAMLAFLLSYFIYSKIILNIFPTHSYSEGFRKIPELKDIVPVFMRNLGNMIALLKEVLKSGFIYPLIIGIILNIYSIFKYSSLNRMFMLLVYILIFSIVILSSTGVMLFASNPPSGPRVYTGFISVLLFPYLILSIYNREKFFYLGLGILLVLCLIVVRATLNASIAEFKFHSRIANQIQVELSLSKVEKPGAVLIIGSPSLTNVTKTNSQNFPIITQVIPKSYRDSLDIGRFTLMLNGFPAVPYPAVNTQTVLKDMLAEEYLIAKNHIYSLYVIENTPIVYFK